MSRRSTKTRWWATRESGGDTSTPRLRGIALALAGALVLLAGDYTGAARRQDNGSDFCSQTARAAAEACEAELDDDEAIAIGACLNTANPDARARCIEQVGRERPEREMECRDQFDARLDLCLALGEAPYDPPQFSGRNFVNPLDIGRSVPPNPYFPLVPGSTWTYEAEDETINVEVLGEVEMVGSVPCTAVRDLVEEDDEPAEDTIDLYAQHVNGTVWYCGERSVEYENGVIASLDGSWIAGRNGARAGILMLARPRVGDVYRQEFALGDAEDAAEVISVAGAEGAPAARCSGECVITRDFTPIEPGVSEKKFYARGVGLILEVNEETGDRVELVEYHIGPGDDDDDDEDDDD